MSDESDAVRLRVRGRVQGVGFRWWTKSAADALGLGGSVRNLPDGSVEVRAWGEATALAELERRLHRGPAYARVDEVVSLEPDQSYVRGAGRTVGGREGFVILR